MKTISIAKDFSVYPGGRTPEDGPNSGQEFRDNLLIPALLSGQKTSIDFDGVRGYGSSFLEESFGGLIRKGFSREQILSQFKFVSNKQSIIAEVERYIEAASKK